MDDYKWSLVWKWCWTVLGSCDFNESKRTTYFFLFSHSDFAHLLYVTPISHCTWNKNTHFNFPFKRWCELSAKCSLHIQLNAFTLFSILQMRHFECFFFQLSHIPIKWFACFLFLLFVDDTHTRSHRTKACTNVGKMKTVYLNLNRIFVKCAFCSKRTNTWLYNRSLHWLDKSDSKLSCDIYIVRAYMSNQRLYVYFKFGTR